MIMRNNSSNRRFIFNKLFLMITGKQPKTHFYSQVVEFIRKLDTQ